MSPQGAFSNIEYRKGKNAGYRLLSQHPYQIPQMHQEKSKNRIKYLIFIHLCKSRAVFYRSVCGHEREGDLRNSAEIAGIPQVGDRLSAGTPSLIHHLIGLCPPRP